MEKIGSTSQKTSFYKQELTPILLTQILKASAKLWIKKNTAFDRHKFWLH